jgi:hypothetical protein
MQIKNFPHVTSIADDDVFLVQTATDNAYKYIKASELKTYFGSGSGTGAGGGTGGSTQTFADQMKAITSFSLLLATDTVVNSPGTSSVQQWTDQSGNSKHASYVDGVYPSVVANGCPSGKGSINFFGNTHLDMPVAVTGTQKTIWVACFNQSSSGQDTYMLGSKSGVMIFGYDNGNSAAPRLYAGNSDYFSSSIYSATYYQWKIFELNIDASRNATLTVNNVVDSKTIQSSSDFNFDRISGYSGGRYLNGQLAVVAATTNSLTSQQRQSIRNLIATYVGITL